MSMKEPYDRVASPSFTQVKTVTELRSELHRHLQIWGQELDLCTSLKSNDLQEQASEKLDEVTRQIEKFFDEAVIQASTSESLWDKGDFVLEGEEDCVSHRTKGKKAPPWCACGFRPCNESDQHPPSDSTTASSARRTNSTDRKGVFFAESDSIITSEGPLIEEVTSFCDRINSDPLICKIREADHVVDVLAARRPSRDSPMSWRKKPLSFDSQCEEGHPEEGGAADSPTQDCAQTPLSTDFASNSPASVSVDAFFEETDTIVKQVLSYYEDEQIVQAAQQLESLESLVAQEIKTRKAQSHTQENVATLDKIFALLAQIEEGDKYLLLKNQYAQLNRCIQVDRTMGTDNKAWKTQTFGKDVKVGWIMKDDGSCIIRCQGVMDEPAFNILAIVNETDLFHEWVPFVKEAACIGEVGRVSKVIWQVHHPPWPLEPRESVMFGFGVDALDVAGINSVLVVAWSLPGSQLSFCGHQLPPPKCTRMNVDYFVFFLYPEDKQRTRVRFIINVDPHIKFIPMAVQNFCAKAIASWTVSNMTRLSRNWEGSVYDSRVKAKPSTYGFIKQRLKQYWEKRDAEEAGGGSSG